MAEPKLLPACALAALCFLACAEHAVRPVFPEREAAARALRGEPVVVLSDSTFWEVRKGAEGNRMERRQVVWYRVNRRNPTLLEDLIFYDDRSLQDPVRIRLDAYYEDGRHWSATEQDLKRENRQSQWTNLEEEWFYHATIPRYAEGLLIRCETAADIFRPEFHAHDYLRGEFPCMNRFVSFRAPEHYRLKLGFRNGEALAVHADTLVAAGVREIRLSARGLPKLSPASRQPRYPEAWYAALHFSVPPKGETSYTWKQLGDHYLDLIRASLEATGDVKAVAAGLSGSDPDSLTAQAFMLLKNRVRYLADEQGMNGWIPRPPKTVWNNGYGDCKEMANLMRALLSEKGVATSLALIRSGSGFQLLEDFPSLGDFNHTILYRNRGVTVDFVDATMPSENAASSYFHLLGQKALLLRPGASSLDTVRPGPGYANRVTTTSRLLRGGDGQWELRGDIGLKGKVAADLGLRLRYGDASAEAARAAVADFLATGFGVTPRDFSWRDVAGDSLVIAFSQRADGMLLDLGQGGLKLDVPWIFGAGRGDDDQDGDRQIAPFEQSDRWELPPGFRKLQKKDLALNAALGRWSLSGSEAAREFRSSGMHWKADERADWLRFQDALGGFSLATVWR